MDLSDFFITRGEATDFVTKLTTVYDSMYTTNFSIESALVQQFGVQKKDAFLKLFRDNKINSTNTKDVQEFLKKIQESVTNLPLIELAIAFEPTEETLRLLSQWFLVTLNKQVLLQIQVNPTLLAGAAITGNGKFQDYSIIKQFNDIVAHAFMQKNPQPGSAATHTALHQNVQSIEIGR